MKTATITHFFLPQNFAILLAGLRGKVADMRALQLTAAKL